MVLLMTDALHAQAQHSFQVFCFSTQISHAIPLYTSYSCLINPTSDQLHYEE
ncbi:MAG TPA: hypothetical protein VL461_01320 [Dictyobacter sp.]|nr:hypothetical protein [Dictyobacter sp.]